MLEQAIKKKKQYPENLAELKHLSVTEWDKLDMNVIMNHTGSMPKNLQAVIKAGHDIISY